MKTVFWKDYGKFVLSVITLIATEILGIVFIIWASLNGAKDMVALFAVAVALFPFIMLAITFFKPDIFGAVKLFLTTEGIEERMIATNRITDKTNWREITEIKAVGNAFNPRYVEIVVGKEYLNFKIDYQIVVAMHRLCTSDELREQIKKLRNIKENDL